MFQLRLTRANEALESEKRDLTVLLEKRSKEIERLNGKKVNVIFCFVVFFLKYPYIEDMLKRTLEIFKVNILTLYSIENIMGLKKMLKQF